MGATLTAVNEVSAATSNQTGAENKKGKASKASLRSKKANVAKMMRIESGSAFSSVCAHSMAKDNDDAIVASLQSFWNTRLEACDGDEMAAAVSGHSLLSNRSYRRFMPDIANAAKKHTTAVEHGATGLGSMTLLSLLTRTIRGLFRNLKENAETGSKASIIPPAEWISEPNRSLILGAMKACNISPAIKPSDAGLASLCNTKATQVTLLIETVAKASKGLKADWDTFTGVNPLVAVLPPVPVTEGTDGGKKGRSKAKDKAGKVPVASASSAE